MKKGISFVLVGSLLLTGAGDVKIRLHITKQ